MSHHHRYNALAIARKGNTYTFCTCGNVATHEPHFCGACAPVDADLIDYYPIPDAEDVAEITAQITEWQRDAVNTKDNR